MKERPILFSGPMVRAILTGKKTQTRRLMRPQPEWDPAMDGGRWWISGRHVTTLSWERAAPVEWMLRNGYCPHGVPGDRVWVRETFARSSDLARGYVYAADSHVSRFDIDGEHWTPSIHMPRQASRIDLEIVSVRAERLRDISEADAHAEGAPVEFRISVRVGDKGTDERIPNSHRGGFANLWDHINGDRATWESNPWVWVVEFKRVRP